jgi:hypothetical protein
MPRDASRDGGWAFFPFHDGGGSDLSFGNIDGFPGDFPFGWGETCLEIQEIFVDQIFKQPLVGDNLSRTVCVNHASSDLPAIGEVWCAATARFMLLDCSPYGASRAWPVSRPRI